MFVKFRPLHHGKEFDNVRKKLLDKNGNPKVAMHIEHHFQWALKKVPEAAS